MAALTPWDWVRAALITGHLLAVTVMAIPAPRGAMKKGLPNHHSVDKQLEGWLSVARPLGIADTTDELEEFVVDVGRAWSATHKAMLDPGRPYIRATGARQSWHLFSFVDDRGGRLRIEIDEGEGFRTVYQTWTEDQWRADFFENGRLRGGTQDWAEGKKKGGWTAFSNWVADEAFEDFPDAERVRLSFLRVRTPSPEKARRGESPEGKVVNPLVVEREP